MTHAEGQNASIRDSFRPGWFKATYCLYVLLIIVFAFWIGWRGGVETTSSPMEWTKGSWTPSGLTTLACVTGVLALTAVPFYPPTGLLIYCVLMYGFARYTSELEFVYLTRLPEIVLGTSLAGWFIWNRRQGWNTPVPSGFASIALSGLLIWELVAACVAAFTTHYWPPHIGHDPTRLLGAGIAFFIAATCLTNRRDIVVLVMVLASTLVVRDFIWRSLTYLDGDISALLAITIPLVLGAVSIADRVPIKLAFLGVALYLTWLLYTTQNRAAGVALLGALVVLWLCSPRKLVTAGITLVLIFAAIPYVRQTHYWHRFESEIYRDGRFVGSAQSRLEIWDATWNVVQQRPLFGTGPGSVSRIIGEDPHIGHYFAHNNYLELLVETGVPGLCFYLAFFATIMFLAWRLHRASSIEWTRRFARYLAASLAAYLICGMFISRQDLALAYLVAGIVVALSTLDERTATLADLSKSC